MKLSIKSFAFKSCFMVMVMVVFMLLESCSVSNTVVSRYTSDQPSRAQHLSHVGKTQWSYLWGLLSAEDWDAGCQQGSDMSKVRVRVNPLFLSISFLSLGIVVPQRLEWDCGPPCRGTGIIGTDN